MSAARRKAQEQSVWLNNAVHVWNTKGGELTVVNLRNPQESLRGAPDAPVAASKLAVPRSCGDTTGGGAQKGSVAPTAAKASSPPAPPPRAAPAAAAPAAAEVSSAARAATGAGAGAKARATPQNDPPVARPQSKTASPPPQRQPESTAATFELMPGTKIPGRGVVSAADADAPKSIALFHDPLWANEGSSWGATRTGLSSSSSAFPAKSPAKSLSELFGAGTGSAVVEAPVEKPAEKEPPQPPLQPQPQELQQQQQQLQQQLQQQGLVLQGGGMFSTAALTWPTVATPGAYPSGVPIVAGSAAGAVQLAGFPFMNVPVAFAQPQAGAAFPTIIPYSLNNFGAVPHLAGVAATPIPNPVVSGGVVWPRMAEPGSPSPSPSGSGINVEAKPFVPATAL